MSNIKYDKYMPLYAYLSPASIPQIVAHIQDYLVKHPILSVETIAEIIVQSLQEHPELINGEAIPISADSEQSIKAYIDSLPSVDTYTKAEINLLLTGKQDTLTFDQAPTPGSSNPVTSSGIIAAMSAMNEALETLINGKADSATTYTKSQVDTLLTDKANTDDVYSKNTMDAKLLEYATSDSVYSKTDINTMKQVNKANLAIVSTDGMAPLDIAAGQYVYFNDVMYMATEEILTGVQLVPNANIVINPIGVTNRIGDGLKNAVTQINGLAETVSNQSQQIDELGPNNTLTSDSATAALSAAQGKALKGLINGLGPINAINNESTTAALSAAMGKYLGDNCLLFKGQVTGSMNDHTDTGIYYSAGVSDCPSGTDGFGAFAVFNATNAGSRASTAQFYWGYSLTRPYFRQFNHAAQAWTNWELL